MSRLCKVPGWAKLALGLLLLGAASTACEEDSKTAPDKCGTPQLLIYDVQGGAQGDAEANPCVTNVGHAVSEILPATPSGGNATGGTASGGSAGKGGGGSAGKGGGGSAGKSSSAGQGGQGGGDAGTGGA